MNGKNLWRLGAFGVALVVVLGAKCPSIPSIQESAVQLVLTKSTVVGPFVAAGNDIADDGVVDVVADYGIKGAIEDNNIDLSDVESITVRTIEVRVSKPDPDGTRTIQGGTVMATLLDAIPGSTCAVGFPRLVVSNWTGTVNEYQTFSAENVEVSQAGIDLLNCILAGYLDAIKAGNDPSTIRIQYDVDGNTMPATDADFEWEVKVSIDIVGEIHQDVIG